VKMANTGALEGETESKPGEKRKNYKPLTPKQEKFCELVVMGKSHADAYKMAYDSSGYSVESLSATSSGLAAQPRIVLRIAALRLPAEEKFQKYREAWLFRLMGMAMADVRRAFDNHGNPIDIPDLPDDIAPNVAGYEQVEDFEGRGESRARVGYTKKVKLIPPLEAMKLFGEALQWFPSNAGGKLGARVEIKDKDRSIKIELVKAGG